MFSIWPNCCSVSRGTYSQINCSVSRGMYSQITVVLVEEHSQINCSVSRGMYSQITVVLVEESIEVAWSKHKKVQTNAHLFQHGHTVCKYSGKSALSSHKTNNR